jgi:hypothetical protein
VVKKLNVYEDEVSGSEFPRYNKVLGKEEEMEKESKEGREHYPEIFEIGGNKSCKNVEYI